MRPHVLRFAGIGPYPEPVEIDFDEIGALGLYLIVGPTGAGKTTIFDAIAFALYGEVAGSRQSALKSFVSDHPFQGEPFVELEFSHRGDRWRVRRRPPSEERSTRPGDHRLARLDAGGGEAEALTGTRDVTERIETLLGLALEQFTRVVLIPQNEFQDFLIAKRDEKEEILRALFDTSLYRRVAEAMQGEARGLRQAAEQLERALDVTRGIVRETLAGLVATGLVTEPGENDEELSAAAAAALVAALAERAAEERAVAVAAQERAAKALAAAEEEARRFDAAAALSVLREEERREAAADAEARTRLEAHRRGAQVAEPARRAGAAAEALQRSEAHARTAREALAAVLASEVRPLASLAALAQLGADAPADELRTAATRIGDRLARARDLHAGARREREAAGEARTRAAEAEQALEQHSAEIRRLEAETAQHALSGEQLLVTAGELLPAQQRVGALEQQEQAAAVEPAQEARDAAAETFRRAEAAQTLAEERLAAARAALDAEHAGRLARALAPGEPCPVCGALDHPAPAPSSPAAAAADALEEAQRAAADRAAAARESLRTAEQALAGAIAAREALPPPAERERLRAALQAALDAQAGLPAHGERLAELGRQHGAAVEAKGKAAAVAAGARGEADTRGQTAERLAGEAAAIAPEPEVAPALAALTVLDEAVTARARADAALAEAQGAAQIAQAALGEALRIAGFATAAEAAAAVVPPAELAALEERDTAATARVTRIAQAEAVAGTGPVPLARPDTAVLAETARAASAAQNVAVERAGALEVARRTLAERAIELADREPAAIAARSRASEADRLALLFKNGNAALLPLEGWVLRTFFEEVCEVATVRLEQLSRGRYRLALDERAGAKKGLAIVVFDAYTGKTRPVELLSGGEKFLASLALALGLADVVQAQAGGIDLSTMFIDEGFGSLDQDTLDSAIEVLRDLLGSGRTIGVITHVEAMKQELPVGLEVQPRADGTSQVLRGPGLAA